MLSKGLKRAIKTQIKVVYKISYVKRCSSPKRLNGWVIKSKIGKGTSKTSYFETLHNKNIFILTKVSSVYRTIRTI